MCDDPIVREVRAAREKIFAECGYDLHRVLQRDRELVRQWPGKVVTREDLIEGRRSPEERDD